MRKREGFTLVELLVAIAVSSTVMLAAASLLLMGVRVSGTAREDAGEQQTVRTVFSMLEDVASGSISRVEPLSGGWLLRGRAPKDDTAGPELLRYEDGSLSMGGVVVLDGLRGASAEVSEDGTLLTFTFRTEEDTYSTAIYCRTAVLGDSVSSEDAADILGKVDNVSTFPETGGFPEAGEISEEEKDARYSFLQTLAAQYGSTGQIIGGNGTYFSQWYIEAAGGVWGQNGWGPDTPWCACFLSWAAALAAQSGAVENPPYFANVDNGMSAFKDSSKWADGDSNYTPIPGDYIFFDWSGGADPAHAGAVLYVEDGYVYTIEGNSGGRVAVQKYSLDDPRIVGYGLLDWAG